MAAIIELVIAGAVGGLLSNFGARWIYRVYSRPTLQCFREGSRRFVESPTGKTIEHRVKIKNIGNTSADNCKAKLSVRGKRSERGEELHYHINETSHWIEEGRPTRIQINPSEIAEIAVYRYGMDLGSGIHGMFFPSDDGWSTDNSGIEVYKYADGEVTGLEFEEYLLKPHFEEMEWYEFSIGVTADKAKQVSANLSQTTKIDEAGVEGKLLNVNQISPAPPRYPDN